MKIKLKALNGEKTFDDLFDNENEAFLDVAERHGLKLPHGCRAGSCGVCRVQIKGDLSALLPRGIVEEDTASRCHDPENIRLACQLKVKNLTTSSFLEVCIAPEAVIPDDE